MMICLFSEVETVESKEFLIFQVAQSHQQTREVQETDTCEYYHSLTIGRKRKMCFLHLSASTDFSAPQQKAIPVFQLCLQLPGSDCLSVGIITQFLLYSAKGHFNLGQTIRVQEQTLL